MSVTTSKEYVIRSCDACRNRYTDLRGNIYVTCLSRAVHESCRGTGRTDGWTDGRDMIPVCQTALGSSTNINEMLTKYWQH